VYHFVFVQIKSRHNEIKVSTELGHSSWLYLPVRLFACDVNMQSWSCTQHAKVLSSVLLFQQERTDQTNGSEEGWHTSAPRTSYPWVQPTTQQWLWLRLNWSSPKPYRNHCWW